MVNTNKVINYLTQKHPFLDKPKLVYQDLVQDGANLDGAGARLEDWPMAQVHGSSVLERGKCPGLLRDQSVEPNLSASRSENFMLGASITSFHKPLKF